MLNNPALAKTMKANDLGKLGTGKKRASAGRDSTGSKAGEVSSNGRVKREKTGPDDEPWLERIRKVKEEKAKQEKGARLAELSDDE